MQGLENDEMNESNFSSDSDDMVSSESRDRLSHSNTHVNEIIVDIEGLDGQISDDGKIRKGAGSMKKSGSRLGSESVKSRRSKFSAKLSGTLS